jgi:maleate isomerase
MGSLSKRALIGMLTPSSNTVVEPYTQAMLHDLLPEVTAHFQRFVVTEIALSQSALSQFDNEMLIEAAEMLAHARVGAIAWNGTSSGWLGFDADIELCRAITERTGIPATTSVLAINEALTLLGAKTIGLVTPYLDDVQARIVANYQGAGFQVVAERHFNDRGNFSFSEYDEPTIASHVLAVGEAKPDAIVIFCTNLRGPAVVAEMEAATGLPVLDTVCAAVWKCLLLTGVDPDRVKGWGRQFRLGSPSLAAASK